MMVDQATALRGLVEKRATEPSVTEPGSPTRARTIAVTSGKGGVGKSCIALNLAIAFAETGRSVCLLDACLGLGSIDLLCGMNSYWNLSHFLTGARDLDEIVQNGPAGIHIVPGASGLTELADSEGDIQTELLRQIQRLEHSHDILIVDTGSGIHKLVRQFAAAADQALIVTVPEVTAIADAYATVKALSAPDCPALELIVNVAESEKQGKQIGDRLSRTASAFLKVDVRLAGTIRNDVAVPESVASRSPLLISRPDSVAARDIRRLASRLLGGAGSLSSTRSYFDRLAG
jgi:flagellar biosynthesis protein FlhG